MTEEIKKELSRLEQQHDSKILYAVESGSRAWGFTIPLTYHIFVRNIKPYDTGPIR